MSNRFCLVGVLALLTSPQAFGSLYSMANLGSLGGTTTSAASINASGQIAGSSTDSNGILHAFLWTNGQMINLNGNTGLSSKGTAVNDFGEVMGGIGGHIFVYSNGQLTDLGIPLGGSACRANGLNNSGEITGQYTPPSGPVHGFLYNPANDGSFSDIGTLGGQPTDFSYGSSVNSSGQIEGDSINANGLDHAFIWTGGTFKDLGTLGGNDSSGIHVNDAGHATGTGELADNETFHVFYYDGTTMHDCGSLGGDYANAGDMNNNNVIVGYSLLADNVTDHAFIYADGEMTDLNTLIPANSGWTLTGATGINDSGEIVANGVNSEGDINAFLLTPLPEPGMLSIVGSVIFLGLRRRSGRKAAL